MIVHRRVLGLCCLYILVFFLCGTMLNGVIRAQPVYNPSLGRMDEKLALLEKYRKDVEVLLIGTSRTARQVDVPYLEYTFQQKGCAANALNIGVPNLTLEEMQFVLDRVRDEETPNLKLIVLEEPIYAQHKFSRIKTDRLRHFSTWGNTYTRFINIWSAPGDIARKLYRSAVNVAALGYELSNLGHLSRIVFTQAYQNSLDIDDDNHPAIVRLMRAQKGFVSLDQEVEVLMRTQQRHRHFIEQQKPSFEALLNRQVSGDIKVDSQNIRWRGQVVNKLLSQAAKGGVQAVFFIPPLPEKLPDDQAIIKYINTAHILNFNDPAAYPEFWDADLWFDDTHVNEDTARAMSGHIAAQLCPLIKSMAGGH